MSTLAFEPTQLDALRAALARAGDGSEIRLAAGEFRLHEPLVLRADVTLRGEPDKTRLVGGEFPTILVQKPEARITLRGLVLEGAVGEEGATFASRSKVTLTVDLCRFRRNLATDSGGAMALFDADATISRCIFEQNDGREGGGALLVGRDSSVKLERCVFRANRGKVGGAIWVRAGGAVRITHCTFSDNEATFAKGGGALFLKGQMGLPASAFVANSVITGREAVFADPGTELRVFFRNSVLPEDLPSIPGFSDVAGNVRARPSFVNVGNGLVALAPGSAGVDMADPKFTEEAAMDLLGRPLLRAGKADAGALARAPS